MKKYKCENCGNEHDGSYGSGRFCSKHCERSFCSKQVKNHKCNFPGKKPAAYGRWICKFCKTIFRTREELKQHLRSEHQQKYGPHGKGQIAWNKNLTAETSFIIRKSRQTLKQHIADGTYIPHRTKLSKSTREKISKTRSLQCNERRMDGFKDVKWYKIKNIVGQEFSVRGHWEERVALRLNELGIIWTKAKPIPYFNGDITRHYVPDFWLPTLESYVEVKGYYSDENIKKMKLVIQQYPEIKIFFLYSTDYFNFVNAKSVLDNSQLMKLSEDKFWHR